ncbi:hypothetical protein ABL78_0475 [Leptomonas seymouri]|uniref:N-acetyltransferase domain-containing protein n=1 Tax=Leptomonas seymouri TaxID=5684 RepID=A0A0N0P8W0_LEPSE|nr:hypothetical protein ABL78_0475 [Leptomonas seymouri]|eukprot:KPI90399.1 hypothetical protein ABL78_0475 [Leptomonas seymouri]
MKASSAPSLTSNAELLSQFDVYCLRKPRSMIHDNVESFLLDSKHPPPPLTYGDVVDDLDSENWSFAPYPRCDRGQLLQVHAYWVAVPKGCEAKASSAPLESVVDAQDVGLLVSDQPESVGGNVAVGWREALTDSGTAAVRLSSPSRQQQGRKRSLLTPRFSCVVGVVWVRLSQSTSTLSTPNRTSHGAAPRTRTAGRMPVEGYLQVVLTHPNYRRRGLASWLLRTCMESTQTPANAFASHTDSGEPYTIYHWHLHTLMAPSLASHAKRRRFDGQRGESADEREEGSDAAIVNATLSMYRRLGFTERRFLYKYYAGKQDAVELIKKCS